MAPDIASGLEQTRTPDPVDRVMNALYAANESTAGTVVGAVGSFIPGVDTLLDVADVGLNVWRVSQPEHRTDPQAWINLGTTAVGVAIPLAGDTVEAALKAVLKGGGEAAQAAMRTLGPALRRAGLDPARYLADLAEQVPRLLTRGLDAGVGSLQRGLQRLGATDRLLVPDWLEAAAGPTSRRLGALADAVRQPLQNVAGEIRGALRALAMAAEDGAERGARRGAGASNTGATAAGRSVGTTRPATNRNTAGGTPQGPGGLERPRRERTPGRPEEQLTDAGRLRPPLRANELRLVEHWQGARNTFLSRWRDRDISAFPAETQRLLRGRSEAAVRNHMTPDDMAGVLKEKRGEVISDAAGRPYNHLEEARNARQSLINTINGVRNRDGRFVGGINQRLDELQRAGRGSTAEARLLQERRGDLSRLLDQYPRPSRP